MARLRSVRHTLKRPTQFPSLDRRHRSDHSSQCEVAPGAAARRSLRRRSVSGMKGHVYIIAPQLRFFQRIWPAGKISSKRPRATTPFSPTVSRRLRARAIESSTPRFTGTRLSTGEERTQEVSEPGPAGSYSRRRKKNSAPKPRLSNTNCPGSGMTSKATIPLLLSRA